MIVKIIRNLALAMNLFYYHPFIIPTVLGRPVVNNPGESPANNADYYDDDDDDDEPLVKKTRGNYEDGVLSLEKDTFINDIFVDSSMDHDTGSGFSLYLLALYEPSCKCADDLITQIESAAYLLEEHFDSFGGESGLQFLSMPVVGKLNVIGAERDTLQSLFEVEETPILRFVMVEHMDFDPLMDSLSNDEKDPGIYSLDYVGKGSAAKDIFDTVLHYWYRLIVSENTEYHTIREMVKHDSVDLLNFDNMDLVPTKPLFSMSSMEEMTDFIFDNASYMFKTSTQDFYGTSEREERYIRDLMRNDDPYLAFVQCRKYPDGKSPLPNLSMFQEFDELALHYLYRKDVAFFAVVSDNCDWIKDRNKKFDPNSNGIVRILEIYTQEPSEHRWAPAIFDPSSETVFQPASSDEIMIFNMTQFAIVQSTPSIMWFDRYTTATMAFPTYRELHFVLFVDVHSPITKGESIDRTYLESRLAITLLHETAKRHKKTRPFDDVVFMIVPSSATHILTTFGIDFWSQMDMKCSDGDCFEESIPSLPAAMITSRAKSSDYMEVFHLPSTKMGLDISSCSVTGTGKYDNVDDDNDDDDYEQEDNCNGNGTGGSLYKFLNSYFERTIAPTIKSEQLPEQYIQQNYTLSSGVQIATTNTFQDMVLADHKQASHSIVYFYNPTCGFCKRFDTTWHNLARLVSKMKWNSQISVVKVDISKNDLHLDGVNIKSVPAVYFFGKGRKDMPQKMMLEDDYDAGVEVGYIYSNLGSVVDPTVILKWVVEMLGKEDLEYLRSLAGSEE